MTDGDVSVVPRELVTMGTHSFPVSLRRCFFSCLAKRCHLVKSSNHKRKLSKSVVMLSFRVSKFSFSCFVSHTEITHPLLLPLLRVVVLIQPVRLLPLLLHPSLQEFLFLSAGLYQRFLSSFLLRTQARQLFGLTL